MEEDVGVKGTVTRLRRRLSIEKTEDVSSPSTPTKKRGGRLAAKPQLELIDENAQINSPKKTRRKSVKDITDAEEKPVTPSRRSTRIKSNTSIVSETTSQTTDSPRARRALRRTSQAGSDNEGPVTPARQTRRTRKDSASSVENQDPVPTKPLQVVEMVIAEEPETELANKSKSSPQAVAEELSPNSARKSKRLLEKRNRRSGSCKSDHNLSTSSVENISPKDVLELNTAKSQDKLNKTGESKEHSEQLSESNISLLKTLDAEHKINTSNHNKSVPTVDNKKKKRNRTESWPVVLTSPANDNIMFSDNEQSKKKRVKLDNNFAWTKNSGSSLNNTDIKEDKNKTEQNDNDDSQILIESPQKRKKRKSETSFSKEEKKPSEPDQLTETIVSKEESLTKNTDQKNENKNAIHNIEDNADNTSLKSENNGIPRETAMFFEKSPSNVQAIIYFEDSDSNSVNNTTNNTQQLDSEDQCVPVVKQDIKFQEKQSPLSTNLIPNEQENIFAPKPIIAKESCNEMRNDINDVDNSCEPMDIDETIHEEILQKSTNSLQSSIVERKSLSHRNSISEEPNKSKIKSIIALNDTSKIENKSTLILSQLKDVSKTSDSVQSPKPPSEILSKSTTNVHENTKKVAKDNLSLNDLKGTPLKQINVQKLTMQTSTPIATQQIDKTLKTEEKSVNIKNNSSSFSESIDKSRSEKDSDEESYQKSNLIDEEAEEASDDYESGDSRDEEERQYEEEHEIIEQGETLGSEEDLTSDSDYEKDSFIVSSDAEDDDLLSGSGDDLSMSDKELSMSKKSKTKYNERKLKEQKNASREMFESRHKLNTSEKKSPALKTKSNRMRIDSSLLESDEEIVVKPKKNKRLRLDSTPDKSNRQDDVNESLNKSNTKSNKSIQKSICNESAINEKEITICNENLIHNTDPLQTQFKQEPKTPQKDLDMSVVHFTSRQDIENVEVYEEKSILNQTGTDPLQATMIGENTSDSNENEEIMRNYDSVLNDLIKNRKGKLNSNNLSLNIDKKAKNNKNEPILDQLNLTHTKRSKKIAKEQSQDVVDSKTPELSKGKRDSDSLSDSSSIDLNLLFSEDNCESEDDSKTKKEELSKEDEVFVPLRKSNGKTNIGESGDDLFFVDTTGAQDNEKENELEDAPVEVLFTSKKKQKKDKLDTSHNKSETNGEGTVIIENSSNKRKSDTGKAQNSVVEENTPPAEGDSKKKKKKKKKQTTTSDQSGLNDVDADGGPEETSYKSEKATDQETNLQIPENTPPVENGDSKKKKKKKKKQNSTSDQSGLNDVDSDGAPEETSYKSEKATDQETNLQIPENTPPAENGDSKKKKKKKKKQNSTSDQSGLNDVDSDGAPEKTPYKTEKATDQETNLQIPENTPPAENSDSKKKKKKKKKQTTTSDQSGLNDVDSDGAPEETPYKSEKATDQGANLQDPENTEPADSGSGKKKKKKKKKQATASEQADENSILEQCTDSNSNKRKRKSSDLAKTQDSLVEGAQESVENEMLNESSLAGRQKKKRKISMSHQDEAIDQNDVQADGGKKKKKNREINFMDIAPEPEMTQIQLKKNKKRKQRDEDIDIKNTKVSKDNSLHEVHMPPLPDSILSQLDDKPRKFARESKVISTSKFVVENARQKRAKPSNYLEESIYLDGNSPIAKKDKSRMKKPKVLPFIPTASISDCGFTTNFQIKKISQNIEFVAGPTETTFSKDTYLQKKGIKKLGTYDHYKKQMSRKLCKF